MKFAIIINNERMSSEESVSESVSRSLELVKMAEKGGFDIAFTGEHHTIEFTISPNPFIVLSQWAEHTKRIRLGSAILTAPYWDPIRLAGEAGLLDVQTNGRLELGIGRGAYQYEFDRMANGIPQEKGREYLQEIVPAIKELWKGDYEHDGEIWSFPKATAVPKPIQDPHPPLWISARSPNSFEFAVKSGCNIMSTPLRKPFEEIIALKESFDEKVSENQQVTKPELLISIDSCVYETKEEWKVPVEATQNYARYFENLFKNEGEVNNGFPEPVPIEEIINQEDYSSEALSENMMFGTPDQIIKKLKKMEDLGIDYFAYNASFGLPHDVEKRSLELFIQEVMPAFKK